MKKHLFRIGVVAICAIMATTMLVACGGNKKDPETGAMILAKSDIAFLIHNNKEGGEAKYVAVPKGDVTEKDGVITVKVPYEYDVTAKLVELDFKMFFDKHKNVWGKDLTFKRSDRTYPFKIGENSYDSGFAWEAVRKADTVTWHRVGVTPAVTESGFSSAVMLGKGEDGKILNYIGTVDTNIKYTIKGHDGKDYVATVRIEKKDKCKEGECE